MRPSIAKFQLDPDNISTMMVEGFLVKGKIPRNDWTSWEAPLAWSHQEPKSTHVKSFEVSTPCVNAGIA